MYLERKRTGENTFLPKNGYFLYKNGYFQQNCKAIKIYKSLHNTKNLPTRPFLQVKEEQSLYKPG